MSLFLIPLTNWEILIVGQKETIGLPIIIEDGCWIGANVVIMPGVTIKKGCVIGATALVTKDTEPNGLYVGKPAHKIKDLI